MLVRYGPGGDGNRPERLRWMIIYNSSGSTMFIPENSAAERSAMWSYFPYRYNPDPAYGVTSTKKLYNNVAQIGNGPCWNNSSNSANYKTPGGCPSGYTDEGVANFNNLRPNYENGRTGVNHGDGAWMFYFDKDYGCSGTTYMKASIRYCTKTAAANGYVS